MLVSGAAPTQPWDGTSEVAAGLFKALYFAAIRHRRQRRKASGDPYVNHLIEVAELLTRLCGVQDADVLMAAVLHDTIEDTDTTADEIGEAFGSRIRALVEALTDDTTLERAERRRRQLQRVASAERDVRLIKLADHCSNIASLPDEWSLERKREYLDWSERVARACAGLSPALEEEYARRMRITRATLPD